MDIQFPDKMLELIKPGENIIDGLKTVTLAKRPDYTVITNQRILYFDAKLLGRYESVSIPYTKLQHMAAERGLIGYSTITFLSESGEEITLRRVPREQIEPYVNSLENALNGVALEPIMIKRRKGLGGKMVWEFDKPPEMLFRSAQQMYAPPQQPQYVQPNQNPLEVLQMRYARGEISEQEYWRMRQMLEG